MTNERTYKYRTVQVPYYDEDVYFMLTIVNLA